jgi:hypothetical protein
MIKDFNKLRATNPMQGVDIAHQLWRLRHSKRMPDTEAMLIYHTIAENAQSYDQITEVCGSITRIFFFLRLTKSWLHSFCHYYRLTTMAYSH